MECYATPWRLWRDSRLLWHIVVLSFVFECLSSVSLPPSFVSLFAFGGLMPVCRPEGRGTAIRAFIRLKQKQRQMREGERQKTKIQTQRRALQCKPQYPTLSSVKLPRSGVLFFVNRSIACFACFHGLSKFLGYWSLTLSFLILVL